MKRKYLIIALLVSGLLLVGVSLILVFHATANTKLIGGAGFSTFKFVFRCAKGGLYYNLFFCGVLSILISIVLAVAKKRK